MILVLQFRDDQSGWHEVKCIYEAGSLPFNAYRFFNVADPDVTVDDVLAEVKKAEGVILGGHAAGGFEDTDSTKRAKLERITDITTPVIRWMYEHDKPALGACFGMQLMAHALGGTITTDPELAETGIATIELTENGQADPLFDGLDDILSAIVGHKASVEKLPPDATLLATTEKSPIQGFRLGSQAGTQFHPELNYQDLIDRLQIYPEYMDNNIEYDPGQAITAKKILHNFLLSTRTISNK